MFEYSIASLLQEKDGELCGARIDLNESLWPLINVGGSY
jgi:hypothetical protein